MRFLCWLGWGVCLWVVDGFFWLGEKFFDAALFMVKVEYWFKSRVEGAK